MGEGEERLTTTENIALITYLLCRFFWQDSLEQKIAVLMRTLGYLCTLTLSSPTLTILKIAIFSIHYGV